MQLSVSKTKLESLPDRRWKPRFPVNGTAVLDIGEKHYTARPIELGLGGIRFYANPAPPLGAAATLRLDVYGFPEMVHTNLRVIRVCEHTVTAIFSTPRPALARCILWLASWSRKEKVQNLAQ